MNFELIREFTQNRIQNPLKIPKPITQKLHGIYFDHHLMNNNIINSFIIIIIHESSIISNTNFIFFFCTKSIFRLYRYVHMYYITWRKEAAYLNS